MRRTKPMGCRSSLTNLERRTSHTRVLGRIGKRGGGKEMVGVRETESSAQRGVVTRTII